MKSMTVFPFLILACSFQFSCKNKDTPTTPITSTVRDTSFIPLAIGNCWEYADSVFYSPDSVEVYHFTWSVVGKQKIYSNGDSVEAYIFSMNSVGGNPTEFYYSVTSQGLVQYGQLEFDTAGHYSLQSLLLKYPLLAGDSWSESHGDYADQKSCVCTDTLITSPCGAFHCYVIRTGPGVPWYADEYYALNIGLIGGYAVTLGSTTIVQKKILLSSVLH
jgi:hypothetical protein